MIDKLQYFTESYKGEKRLQVYLAHGQKDKIEESFKPMIKHACSIMVNSSRIDLQYNSLNIEKHSATIFEGYYRGLLKMTDLLKRN